MGAKEAAIAVAAQPDQPSFRWLCLFVLFCGFFF
jgi:hypothetical protein